MEQKTPTTDSLMRVAGDMPKQAVVVHVSVARNLELRIAELEARIENLKTRSFTKDMERYQWLRQQFACTDLQMDGTYQPRFRRPLVRARTLDESIDLTRAKDGPGAEV